MKLASRLLIILMLMIVGLAPSVGAGASNLNDGEPPQTPFSGSNTLYLPLVIRPPDFYSVSGQVSDVNSNPVSGVTILDKDGRLAVTNSQGQYSLMVPEGNNILVAGKEGLNFSPSALDVDVGPSTSAPSFMDTSALNFTALAACNEAVSNGGFEMGAASGQLWWNLPEYNLAYYIYPATRVSTPAHPVHSGSYSLRTGILIPTNNWYSYSDAISPPITIPSGITATLSLWRYPVSGEPPSLPLAELPDKSAFGQAPLATDAQYILVVDANNPNVYLETLLWKRSNDAMWLFHTFDLSKFSGKKIRLRLGTYNDGNDQITAQYFDDISLQLCSAATPPPPSPPPPPPPPPPPAGCSERVLNNSFEINGYWTIPVTAYSAGYSSIFVHTGLRSMRTGIYYAGHNRYSYSDFRQAVYIPWSSSSATLRYYVYPYSEESWSSPAPDRPTALEFGQAAMSGDVQYLLILNSAQYWIDTLLWQRSNAQTWIYVEQNLLGYRGSTINLQFGTYNNGYDGVTAMWVDDVSLVTCP